MGDGIMALFGAPPAREDHAVRACYAALRLQDAVKRYAEEARHAYGMNVQIRVGLNSGEVVVRKLAELTGLPFTLTTNKFAGLAAHDDLVMASLKTRQI